MPASTAAVAVGVVVVVVAGVVDLGVVVDGVVVLGVVVLGVVVLGVVVLGAVVVAPAALIEAPHAGAVAGLVISTSVRTSCWPAGTEKTASAVVPAATVRVKETI